LSFISGLKPEVRSEFNFSLASSTVSGLKVISDLDLDSNLRLEPELSPVLQNIFGLRPEAVCLVVCDPSMNEL
jgi:hypothetical protein